MRTWPKSAVTLACLASLFCAMGCGGGAVASPTDGHLARDDEQRQAEVEAPDPSPTASVARQLPPMTLDDSAVQRSSEARWDTDALFPYQTWPEMVGRRRGIVMSAGAQPWGGSVLWGRGLEANSATTPYRFYAERSSAYAVYFASPDGRGVNPINWNVLDVQDLERPCPSAMFQPDTPNEWGLHRKAHLVEVEALRLAGSSNGGLHFVIGSAEVLDATPDYPIVVEDALTQLRSRFDGELARNAARIERLLGRSRARVPAGYEARAPDGPTIAAFPTWLDQERVMDVVFIARYRETHLGPEESRTRPCPPCPCDPVAGCAPCARCDPRPETFRPQVTAGYEIAARYRVTHDGRLASEAILAAKAY